MKFKKINALRGEVTIPGDKSISHRAVMLGAISEGTTRIIALSATLLLLPQPAPEHCHPE